MTQTKTTLKIKNSQARNIFNILLILLLLVLITPPIINRLKHRPVEVKKVQSVVDKNRFQLENNQSIAELAEKVSKSVVSITVSSTEFFYGYDQSSSGTGVVLSKDGYILTNKHVIENAERIMVIDYLGETYSDIKIMAKDPLNDIAFLKIDKVEQMNPIELGDSKTLKVGQPVLAIGNSLGQYQNTVTNGIISGIGRKIVAQSSRGGAEQLTDLIQTNAAINPGNSGGPLINAGGQIIGINTAIAANANNLGFAIPIGAAKGMIKQLLANKPPKRAFVGVTYRELNPATAKLENLKSRFGALIAKNGVLKDSPASKSGLKEGDIIVKVNDYQVGKIGSLNTLVSEHSVGEKIKLTINRNGKQMIKQMVLEDFKRP